MGRKLNAGRYSPLDQITAENVNDLEEGFEMVTQGFGPSTGFWCPHQRLEVDKAQPRQCWNHSQRGRS